MTVPHVGRKLARISLTNGLSDRICLVGDLEVREVFAYFLCHLFWSETHGGDVVSSERQLALRGLHEFHGGTVAVRDVHHGKAGVGAQVALVLTCAERIVEDLNRVVWANKVKDGN